MPSSCHASTIWLLFFGTALWLIFRKTKTLRAARFRAITSIKRSEKAILSDLRLSLWIFRRVLHFGERHRSARIMTNAFAAIGTTVIVVGALKMQLVSTSVPGIARLWSSIDLSFSLCPPRLAENLSNAFNLDSTKVLSADRSYFISGSFVPPTSARSRRGTKKCK